MYVLQVNDAPKHYKTGYFPRRFKLLSEAKAAAKRIVNEGASMARIEFPNGAELDFRPTPTKKGK